MAAHPRRPVAALLAVGTKPRLPRLLGLLLLGLCLALPAQALAACPLKHVAELPITLWRNKLFVPVTVNGSARMFFVDTGADTTSLADGTAAALNIPRNFDHTLDMLGVGGQESHLYIGRVESLALGGVTIHDHDFPISAFGEHMADGEHRPDGLIGADILSNFDVEIDILHRRLDLWRAEGCTDIRPAWSGPADGVPMQVSATHHVSVPVRIDGATLSLLLDTGAPALVLSTRAAAQAGATPDILEQNQAITGFGMNNRSYAARVHIFRRLELGRQVYGDVPAVVVSNGRYGGLQDGLLGVEFLKRGRIWISYAAGMLFTEPQPPAD